MLIGSTACYAGVCDLAESVHGNTVFVGVCVILLHLPFYNFLSWCRPYMLNIKVNIE